MQTAIITLSALIGFSLMVHIVQWAKLTKRKNKLTIKNAELRRYRTDKDDPTAFYRVMPMPNGVYAVNRTTYPDGENAVITLIKLFNTTDAEYNRNEAVELADKLNETLCYD